LVIFNLNLGGRFSIIVACSPLVMRAFPDEIHLITAFHNKQREAENFIFLKFFRPLCLVSYNLTEELPVSEDIVAEVFIKLFDRRLEFERLDNISAFLYVAVRNASITHISTQNRHSAAHQQIAAHAETYDLIPDALQSERLEAELVHSIYQEIENLPGKCRDIFKMIYLQNRSTREIAEALNISPQTVRTQKARAIQLIKTELLKKNLLVALALLLIYLRQFF
jgi:RNA polymerase sigma-70 factor (family 1)